MEILGCEIWSGGGRYGVFTALGNPENDRRPGLPFAMQ